MVIDSWGDQITTFTVQCFHDVKFEHLDTTLREITSDGLEHFSRSFDFVVDVVFKLEVNEVEITSHSLV